MTARHRQHRGFTLLEVLLAMAIVSMVVVSLYASLSATYRARASALASVGPPRAAQIAMDLVCHDLESAIPPSGQLIGQLAGAFIGQTAQEATLLSDAVQFYGIDSEFGDATLPGSGGVRRLELMLVEGDDTLSHNLVCRVTGNLLAQVESEPDERLICRGVKSLTFRYFDGTEWLDSWDSTAQNNVLPAAVEVTVEFLRPGATSESAPGLTMVRVVPLSCHQQVTTQVQAAP